MKTKRFLSMLLCIALAVSCLAGMTVSASADDASDVKAYTVKDGDYLYRICKNNGLDYYSCKSAIMILNGWSTETQCNRIVPGQTIILPASNAVAATVKTSAVSTTSKTESVTINGKTYSSSSSSTISTAANSGDSISYYLVPYTVKSGDYIAKICSDLGTSYTAYKSIINNVNGLNSTKIYAGKVLYIPVSSAPTSGSFYAVMAHRVDKGETMSTICGSYGANASSTMTKGVNDGTNLNYLQAGQVVYVPVTASSINTGSGSGSGTSSSNPAGTVTGTGYNINLLYSSKEGVPTAVVNGGSVLKSNAANTVTIYANAKTGYAISKIVVTRKDTNANVVVKDNAFTMPPCDVDVEVSYSAAHKITKEYSSDGSFETLLVNEEVEYACYGDEITVSPSPKSGKAVLKVEMNGSEIKQSSDGAYTFIMPNKDVTVKVTFGNADFHKINLTKFMTTSSGDVKKAGTVSFSVDGTTATKAAKNSQVVITVAANENYQMTGLAVYSGKPYTSANKVKLTNLGNNKYAFKMLDQDMYVDISFGYTVTYSIAQHTGTTKNGSVSFFVKNSDGKLTQITRANAGTEVLIVPNPASGYKLSAMDATKAGGKSHADIRKPDGSHDYYYVVMPEADVTVVPTWAEGGVVRYRIINSCKEHGCLAFYVASAKGGLEAAPATIPEGTKVYVRTTPHSGYKTEKILSSPDNFTDIATVETDGWSFIMPKHDIEVAAYFTNSNVSCIYFTETPVFFTSNSYATNITGSLTFNTNGVIKTLVNNVDTDNAILGETVTVTITAPAGYNIGRVYAQSTMLHGNVDAGTYSFTYTLREIDKGGVTFQVDLYATEKHSVSYSATGVSGGYYMITINGTQVSHDVADVYVGQKVTIDVPGSYSVESFKIFTGNNSTGPAVELITDEPAQKVFSMPAANVGTQFELK